jgi:2-desacetyl-2-hydroxyethyl bacteriochlorophyllide A dehydrogenase
MRALMVDHPGVVELVERAAPTPAADEVVVAPTLVGVCGTDLDLIDGTVDPAFVRYPLVLGHEWVGRLTQDSGGLRSGQRVVVEGVIPCGHCAACLAGDTNRCETYEELGFTRQGAAAELICVPSRLVHAIDDHVSDLSAVLVEPAAVVHRGLTRALGPAPRPTTTDTDTDTDTDTGTGPRVLVIGDGTVGLLAAALVRQWHPSTVVMAGLRPEQETLARAFGVDRFDVGPDVQRTYDLVVDAAGHPDATRRALASVARGGTVVLLGYPGPDADVPLPVDDLVNGDVVVMGSFSYTSRSWADVVSLINGGLDLDALVTDEFLLADYAAAVARLRHADGVRGKVTLRVEADAS